MITTICKNEMTPKGRGNNAINAMLTLTNKQINQIRLVNI